MINLSSKETTPHDRKVEAIKNFWGFYGAIFPLMSEKGKSRYFKSDLIVDISHLEVIVEQLDCRLMRSKRSSLNEEITVC